MEEEKNITADTAEENTEASAETEAVSEDTDVTAEENAENITDESDDYYEGDDADGDDFSEGDEKIESEIEDTPKRKCPQIHIDKRILKLIRNIVLITVSSVLLIFILLFIIATALNPSDKVARNIWIGNIEVGGKTYSETLQAIEQFDGMAAQQILLKCNDNYYGFSGGDVEANVNLEETAKIAFNYGKSGNFFKDGLDAINVLFTKHTLSPSSSINEDLLAIVLTRFGTDMYGELVQHSVEFDENSAIVTPGHTGFDGNVITAINEVKEAFNNAEYHHVKVTLNSAPPDDFTVETFDHICYKDPVDSRYVVQNNEVIIEKEESGRYLNKAEVEPYLAQIKEGGEKVTVPIYRSAAAITAEDLQAKLFNSTLASYSTYYGSSTSNRAANVARSANLINGKILAPGEVFSFNETVGPRTTKNGFYTATEYANGKSVEGIGGGTCQVSTTLYSAVLYADLNIVSRTNHMMSIGYAPLGQDATVAYGSVDFKFKNSTDYPIKIQTSANGSKLTISIVGTAWDPAREVKLSHSTSMSGANTVVTSVRYVYSDGKLISTDRLGSSVYQPHNSSAT